MGNRSFDLCRRPAKHDEPGNDSGIEQAYVLQRSGLPGFRFRYVRLIINYRWLPYVHLYYKAMEDRKHARGTDVWERELFEVIHEKVPEFYYSVCLPCTTWDPFYNYSNRQILWTGEDFQLIVNGYLFVDRKSAR